jgi:LmbE family N-acetylglucosaminyl deacetylase
MQLEPVFQTPFRIFIVVAHPDDIEFGAAGSVAIWTDAGAEVVYCIVTNGAAGSNDKEVIYDQLVERRKQEQLEAARHVGVSQVHFLGYADGTLQATLELRRDITRLIRQFRPDRVVITDPTAVLLQEGEFSYINHPDHRASAEASLYAVFPSAETRPIFPELLEEGLEPHHVNELYLIMSDKPNVAVDITGAMDRKIQSLLAHRSQLDESVIDMVRGWDSRSGKELDVEYAETFRVMRFYDGQQGDAAPSA